MPVHVGHDNNGPYFQWGGSGKKYYYKSGDKEARTKACQDAARQGRAAFAHGWRSPHRK